MKTIIFRRLSTMLFASILVLVLSISAAGTAFAAPPTVVNVTGDYELTSSDMLLNVSGVARIYTGNSATVFTNVSINCAEGTQLTLEDVNIVNDINDADEGVCPLVFIGAGNTLTVKGINALTGTSSGGGISVEPGVKVEGSAVVTIDGTGELNATSRNSHAAGIGSGSMQEIGTITINGGDITATGGIEAAGIGGGRSSTGGTININGGDITATGGDGGAGIGGGRSSTGGTININGGDITATGGDDAAGIGGGVSANFGTINLSGGVINAFSPDGRDDIGKGRDGGIDDGVYLSNSAIVFPLTDNLYSSADIGTHKYVVFTLKENDLLVPANTEIVFESTNGVYAKTWVSKDAGKVYAYIPDGTYFFSKDNGTNRTQSVVIASAALVDLEFVTKKVDNPDTGDSGSFAWLWAALTALGLLTGAVFIRKAVKTK